MPWVWAQDTPSKSKGKLLCVLLPHMPRFWSSEKTAMHKSCPLCEPLKPQIPIGLTVFVPIFQCRQLRFRLTTEQKGLTIRAACSCLPKPSSRKRPQLQRNLPPSTTPSTQQPEPQKEALAHARAVQSTWGWAGRHLGHYTGGSALVSAAPESQKLASPQPPPHPQLQHTAE